ncbi:hypothetical protein ACRAWF_12120 [Streptomyces sp. L7]
MKFLAITLIVHRPDPVTGIRKPTHERFREVLENALLAEELGLDGFGVGSGTSAPSSPPRRPSSSATSQRSPAASASSRR